MCAVECPSNVNIPKLMLEAKSKYRAGAPRLADRHPPRSRRGRVGAGPPASRPLANPLLSQPLVRRLAEPLTGIDRRRRMPRFARRTLAQTVSARPGRPARADRRRRPGPAPARRWSPTSPTSTPPTTTRTWARPVLRLLQAHGIEVVLPEQRASGIPEMLYGYADAARETAAVQRASRCSRGSDAGAAGPLGRADRQLRLQGPLPRLPRQPGLLHGGRSHPRPGRVPRPLPRRSSRRIAERRPLCPAPGAASRGSPTTSPAISRRRGSAARAWSCSGRSPASRSSTWPPAAAAWPAPSA